MTIQQKRDVYLTLILLGLAAACVFMACTAT